jgi:hypothetical protein
MSEIAEFVKANNIRIPDSNAYKPKIRHDLKFRTMNEFCREHAIEIPDHKYLLSNDWILRSPQSRHFFIAHDSTILEHAYQCAKPC